MAEYGAQRHLQYGMGRAHRQMGRALLRKGRLPGGMRRWFVRKRRSSFRLWQPSHGMGRSPLRIGRRLLRMRPSSVRTGRRLLQMRRSLRQMGRWRCGMGRLLWGSDSRRTVCGGLCSECGGHFPERSGSSVEMRKSSVGMRRWSLHMRRPSLQTRRPSLRFPPRTGGFGRARRGIPRSRVNGQRVVVCRGPERLRSRFEGQPRRAVPSRSSRLPLRWGTDLRRQGIDNWEGRERLTARSGRAYVTGTGLDRLTDLRMQKAGISERSRAS